MFNLFKKSRYILVALGFVAVYFGLSTHLLANSFVVARVVDGDTIEIMQGKQKRSVRIIGLNAPEKKSQYRAGEAFSKEATAYLARLIKNNNNRVTLKTFNNQTDNFKRLLACVYVGGYQSVAEQLIAKGLAFHAQLDLSCGDEHRLQNAENAARRSRLGIWQQNNITNPLRVQTGFHIVQGTITKIKSSRKYNYLVLNNSSFEVQVAKSLAFPFTIGKNIEVRGWTYKSKNITRIKVSNSFMIRRI